MIALKATAMVLVISVAGLALGAETTTAPGGTVTFAIDGTMTHTVSPFIYGTNSPDWRDRPFITLARSGGNRMTAYNWETNASNAGSDWQHQNDGSMGQTNTPALAVTGGAGAALKAGASYIVTVPIIGYVAADKKGDGDVNKTPNYLQTRFVVSVAKKGAAFTRTPDITDGKVYQDEFVNFMETEFPSARSNPKAALFYCLDNEPDLWSTTHARIHPKPVGYDELVKLNIEYAEAIKAVAPKALVFGFVSYGYNGFTTLQNAPDGKGRDFTEFYLDSISAAQDKAKKRLIDVLDLHWYPEARGGKSRISDDDDSAPAAAARVQAPRSLWDKSYVEDSWISKGPAKGAICLLPRINEKIGAHCPGTKLAITEYYYGGGDHISGAIAEADVLGIFGREGVFAAALWHIGKSKDKFIYAAYSMYRGADGKGAVFGDIGLAANTTDVERTSIYVSKCGSGMYAVAINKSDKPISATIQMKGCPAVRRASVSVLTADSPTPAAGKGLTAANDEFVYEMPAMSVSSIIMVP